MFDRLFNKSKSNPSSVMGNPPVKSDDAAKSAANIHVMPEKFLPRLEKSSAGLIKWLVIGLAVMIIFVAGAIFFSVDWSGVGQKSVVNSNQPTVNSINKNINEPTNLNLNASQNSDQNQNVNSLINENLNSNVDIDPNSNVASANKPKLTAAPDIDRDGLSDIEEGILGSDKNKPDTDSDGYLDGSETVKLFDPTQSGGKKLSESKFIATFTNNVYKYTLFYPISFEAAPLDATEKESVIKANTGETFDIVVENNQDVLPIDQWYRKFTNSDVVGTVKETGSGYKYVESSDGLKIYLAANNRVVIFSYLLGTVTELNYKLIFQMMVESFKLF